MRVFDSLSRRVEIFTPNTDKKIFIYVCGLTPYDSAHIGHARTYVSFDLIKRFLIKKGFSFFHMQNITDVDDKIFRRCRETGADPKKLTTEIHEEALGLFDSLNILRADVYPKVSEHMAEIIKLVRTLVDKGAAYETLTGIYFDVSKFQEYGRLSGQNMEEIMAGSRKLVDETKEDPADFALWKKTSGEIIEFDSPWGKGRPGWHIECSAMSLKYAGGTLDIHGGARDLIFPHHENEIAQSEAATGKKFCKYWLHTGFLTVEGEKMSKSLGNFITLKQALSQFDANSLRMFYLQAHYRSPLNYDEEAITAAGESVERIFNTIGLMREIEDSRMDVKGESFSKESDQHITGFYDALEDDFDTPKAMAELFSLLRTVNSHLNGNAVDHAQLEKVRNKLEEILWILGLKEKETGLIEKTEGLGKIANEFGIEETEPEKIIELLIELREELRKKKDYAKADDMRAKLVAIGITLEDKAAGGPRKKVR